MPEKTRECSRCGGRGAIGCLSPGERAACPVCEGSGREAYISFADERGENEALARYYATPGREAGD